MPMHLYPADHDLSQEDALGACVIAMGKARHHLTGMSEKELTYYDKVLKDAVTAFYGDTEQKADTE